jgi:ATP-binding cassette subfamily B protein RaxB
MPPLDFGLKKRVPVILQAEASECGIACIAMIASHFGYCTDLPELRKRFSISLKGSTLEDLARLSETLGLVPRGLRLELEELPQLAKPAILHWDMNHFVVLVSAQGRRIKIIDPASGEVEIDAKDASARFTGVALELTPGLEFKRKSPPPPLRLAQIVGRVPGLRASLMQMFGLALAMEGLALTLPLLTQWTTDEVIVSGEHELLTTLGLAAITLGIVLAAISTLRTWVALYIGAHFNLQWMTNVMGHLLRLPVDFFERRHIGDVVSRFGSVSSITHTLTGASVEVVLDGLLGVGMLAMMLLYSPRLGALAIVVTVIYAFMRRLRYGAVRMASSGALVKHAKEQTFFLETIRGVRSVKLFNREYERRSAWLSLWVDAANSSLKIERLNLVFGAAWNALSAVERAGIFWLGALSVIDHRMSLGMLMAFLSYKEQFTSRVNSLIDRVVDIKLLSVSTERLADIVLAEAEEKPRDRLDNAVNDSTLKIEQVTFRYAPGERAVLSGANLTVRPGECIAIVGPSGCGKTTCLKILLGILRPGQGHVRLGDQTLDQIGLRRFREMVAVVMQDDHLFAGSILDNICFHDAHPNKEWMRECARLAGVDKEIMAMPMGYHTLVGDMGTVLSGGQKQRLLLARALYKRPSILILDEATSHLDVEAERQIGEALSRLSMTRIMIAHRPHTIAIADRVVRLRDGKLYDEPKHQALSSPSSNDTDALASKLAA